MAVPVGMPTRQQSALLSPVEPACAPQDHLEAVLLRHLSAQAGARVEFGTEVVSVESGADGVRAVLRDAAGRASRVVHARYLVAADGAHSSVRSALGIPMRGPDHLAEVVTALFRAPLWDVLGDLRHGIYSVTRPEPLGSSCPPAWTTAGSTGCTWDPEVEQAADFDEAPDDGTVIRLGCWGVPGLAPQIERIGAFSSSRIGTSAASSTPTSASASSTSGCPARRDSSPRSICSGAASRCSRGQGARPGRTPPQTSPTRPSWSSEVST